MDYKQKCIEKLGELTNCSNARLTTRGNRAILLALEIAKGIGYRKVLVPDQGGWLTYRQYPKRLKLEYHELKTEYGLIDLEELKKQKDSILLISTFAGYAAEQPIKELSEVCKRNNLFLIEDASGALGMKRLKEEKCLGIIVASFGKWKAVDLGYGGCIASDLTLPEEKFEGVWDFSKLHQKLCDSTRRVETLIRITDEVKKQLGNRKIFIYHMNKKGIVALTEKSDEVVKYCKEKGYEYTLCPRYVRINEEAISIEIKRLDV